MTLTERQRKILDYVRGFSERRGYAPSLKEIGRHFGLRSSATVHKHLANLEERGALRRGSNRRRAIEVLPEEGTSRSIDLPLSGTLASGKPLVLHPSDHTVPVPPGLVGLGRTFALTISGDGFEKEHLCDGDVLVIEEMAEVPDGALALVVEAGLPAFRCMGRSTTRPGGARGEAKAPAPSLRVRGRVVGVLRKY